LAIDTQLLPRTDYVLSLFLSTYLFLFYSGKAGLRPEQKRQNEAIPANLAPVQEWFGKAI
jgi:hypothetical protein